MRTATIVSAVLLIAGPCAAQPIAAPRMQAVPLPNDEIALERDGSAVARYSHGAHLRRPFVFPIVGPLGRGLTRMGHPHDPVGHSHHNSFWVAHNDVNGVTFWADRGSGPLGRIVHQRVEMLTDSNTEAAIQVVNAWIEEKSGKTLMTERRRIAAMVPELTGELLPPTKEWLLILDLQFETKEPVTLGKTAFGIVGVRMAKSIGVHDGGGTIRNSAGGLNEKGVFWKPAKWVDYSGPIQGPATEGITLFDHPANPNHPAVFHVRDDGWMGPSLTFDAPRKLEPGRPLRLRYGLYVHAGTPEPAALEAQWAIFAKTMVKDLTPKKK